MQTKIKIDWSSQLFLGLLKLKIWKYGKKKCSKKSMLASSKFMVVMDGGGDGTPMDMVYQLSNP